MKIAFLSAFYPYRGGIAQFNGVLFRALEKQHEIKAYTFSRQYPDFLFPGKSQFVATQDNADKIPSVRSLDTINPFTYCKTAKIILGQKPDLLLTDYWMPFFAPSLGVVSRQIRKKGIPAISILSNIIPHEHKPGDVALTKFFLKQNDAYVVLAEAVKNDLLHFRPDALYIKHPHPNYEHFGAKIPKNEARQILGIPADKKVVLFFGLIRDYKGVDILIESFKDLPEDYFLLIAGEVYGSDKTYLDLIEKHKLKNCLFVNRYLDDSEVTPYFSASDVCVLPYRTATQSGIIGIAYHFGVPLISTSVGGLGEMIEPFGTGIMIPEANSELLSNAIRSFFEQNQRDNFISNISKFKENYSWDSLAAQITGLYDKVKK